MYFINGFRYRFVVWGGCSRPPNCTTTAVIGCQPHTVFSVSGLFLKTTSYRICLSVSIFMKACEEFFIIE